MPAATTPPRYPQPRFDGSRPGGAPVPHQHLRVTDADRDNVVEHVKAAYAEGRVDEHEMEERLHLAMTAQTHADLAPIMHDLYGPHGGRPVVHAPAYPPVASGAPMPRPVPRDGGDRVGASAAHLLALMGLVIIGPLIMLLTAGRTSPYIRKHALEALNFHLTVTGATILLPLTVIGVIALPFMWVAAFVLTLVGGAAALADGDFNYPWTLRLIK